MSDTFTVGPPADSEEEADEVDDVSVSIESPDDEVESAEDEPTEEESEEEADIDDDVFRICNTNST